MEIRQSRYIVTLDNLMDAQGRTRANDQRGAGLHLSDVIRHMEVVGLGKEYSDEPDPMNWLMGFCFEKYMMMMLGPSVHPAGEWMLDGILLSPDGLRVEPGVERAVIETKATRRSMRKVEAFATHFVSWIWQVAGYCKATECDRAELYALFINGNYDRKGPGGQPHILKFEFYFSQEDLDEFWKMILLNAGDVRVR